MDRQSEKMDTQPQFEHVVEQVQGRPVLKGCVVVAGIPVLAATYSLSRQNKEGTQGTAAKIANRLCHNCLIPLSPEVKTNLLQQLTAYIKTQHIQT